MAYREKMYKMFNKITTLAIMLISTALLTLYWVIMTGSNGEVFDVVFTGYATVFTLANVLAVSCLTANYRSVGITGKIIRLIGDNTLGIYLLHVFIGTVLMKVYKTIKISENILVNILFALLVLFFSLLAAVVLKKIPLIKELFKIG